ncbi:MAG: lipoyl(octanoyl) transferase LipB [Muribaculaceae bacterium]|nr:lipoyl(octanoyl) transferase LipB [Muribaculaceae bacterium]
MSIEIRRIQGLLPYRDGWDMQHRFLEQVDKGIVPETILLVEHSPVFTLGFHGNASNMLASEELLQSRGAEIIRVERGGDITFHGPGQLVAYPILRLRDRHYGVKSYVSRLEQSVIDTCAAFGIKSGRVEDATGVWCGIDTDAERKICAIGVKVSHGVTMHGLALNVNTDLDWFRLINPCGFITKGVTSIMDETGKTPDLDHVADILSERLTVNLTE